MVEKICANCTSYESFKYPDLKDRKPCASLRIFVNANAEAPCGRYFHEKKEVK